MIDDGGSFSSSDKLLSLSSHLEWSMFREIYGGTDPKLSSVKSWFKIYKSALRPKSSNGSWSWGEPSSLVLFARKADFKVQAWPTLVLEILLQEVLFNSLILLRIISRLWQVSKENRRRRHRLFVLQRANGLQKTQWVHRRNKRLEDLKFLDPTQVEGFKQARDKRQYLSEVAMCPKAIYTLDLTSNVDIDS